MGQNEIFEKQAEEKQAEETPDDIEQEDEGSESSESIAESVTESVTESITETFGKLTICDDSTFLSPETGSTSSSSVGDVSPLVTQRAKLNGFLQECSIQPLGRPWLDWNEVSDRTRRRYLQKTTEIMTSTLKVLSPINATHLWVELQKHDGMNMALGLGKSPSPAERAYLEALAEAYANATSWDTRRQVLSIMAGVASFNTIREYIPGLTHYRFTIANLHCVQYGRNVPVPTKTSTRLRIDPQQLDHFLSFITSPHLIQDLPYGEKELKLSSGEILVVPNVIRTMIHQRIVMQYTQYCSENDFKPFSKNTMLRILTECSASVRKSLQGIDYFACEGARAFDVISKILTDVSPLYTLYTEEDDWCAIELQKALKTGKLYLKGDYKVHVSDDSTVADHCSTHALNDSTNPELRKLCKHIHSDVCDQCHALDATLEKIKNALHQIQFSNEEDRDEFLYLFLTAERAIHAWKAHQLRSVRQDQARLNVLDTLDNETILIVNDWAMKFLPQMYRESQQDWFGRRGISWHISVVFRKIDNELQSQAFVHIVQSCSQDSAAVVVMIQHLLSTLKQEHPEIMKACLRQDNAGCYHSSNTILALAHIHQSTGIKVVRVDFSDPQGGKGAADRLAATCKSHMRIHLNEGHNVTTAKEMKDALLSHGGIKGVRVAVVENAEILTMREQKKMPGINKLNNFEYKQNKLVTWRAYEVGKGKTLTIDKES
ncbi:hypothetical protein QZH41_010037, partial [Actinostola sp. cb2023]